MLPAAFKILLAKSRAFDGMPADVVFAAAVAAQRGGSWHRRQLPAPAERIGNPHGNSHRTGTSLFQKNKNKMLQYPAVDAVFVLELSARACSCAVSSVRPARDVHSQLDRDGCCSGGQHALTCDDVR